MTYFSLPSKGSDEGFFAVVITRSFVCGCKEQRGNSAPIIIQGFFFLSGIEANYGGKKQPLCSKWLSECALGQVLLFCYGRVMGEGGSCFTIG